MARCAKCGSHQTSCCQELARDHITMHVLNELRDQFAGEAMAALLSNPFASREIARDCEYHPLGPNFAFGIAANAYDIANAMIRQRMKNAADHPIQDFIPKGR